MKSRAAGPCSYAALHLVKQANDSYIPSSTWVGTFSGDDEPSPNTPDAAAQSKDFWATRVSI